VTKYSTTAFSKESKRSIAKPRPQYPNGTRLASRRDRMAPPHHPDRGGARLPMLALSLRAWTFLNSAAMTSLAYVLAGLSVLVVASVVTITRLRKAAFWI
jgi:hypothetical protein